MTISSGEVEPGACATPSQPGPPPMARTRSVGRRRKSERHLRNGRELARIASGGGGLRRSSRAGVSTRSMRRARRGCAARTRRATASEKAPRRIASRRIASDRSLRMRRPPAASPAAATIRSTAAAAPPQGRVDQLFQLSATRWRRARRPRTASRRTSAVGVGGGLRVVALHETRIFERLLRKKGMQERWRRERQRGAARRRTERYQPKRLDGSLHSSTAPSSCGPAPFVAHAAAGALVRRRRLVSSRACCVSSRRRRCPSDAA